MTTWRGGSPDCGVDVDAPCPNCSHPTGVHLSTAETPYFKQRCLSRDCDCDLQIEDLGCTCPTGVIS